MAADQKEERLVRRGKMKLKKGTGVRLSNPREELLDEELIGRAVWECFKNGDSEGVTEVIRTYLEAVDKTQIAKEGQRAFPFFLGRFLTRRS